MLVMVDGKVYNSDEIPLAVIFTKEIEIEKVKNFSRLMDCLQGFPKDSVFEDIQSIFLKQFRDYFGCDGCQDMGMEPRKCGKEAENVCGRKPSERLN